MIHKFTFIEKLLLRRDIIPHPVIDSLTNVVAGRALQVAVKAGIFDVLNEEPISLEVIARKTALSIDGTLVLLDCLDALGYIRKSGHNFYQLTSRGSKFFSKSSPHAMKNMVLFSEHHFQNLMKLEKNVIDGVLIKGDQDTFTKEQWDIFTKAMIEMARVNASEVIKLIPLSKNYKKLLDLGGMHGLHAIECCKRLPSLSAEIIDFAPVEPHAKQMIEKCQMVQRVKFRVGDFVKDELGEGHDIILAFNVIHGFTFDVNRFLTEKAYKALNSGGIYAIMEQVRGVGIDSQLSKLFTSSMGLMLFNQVGGRTYSLKEISGWLVKAGFRDYTIKKIKIPGYALIIGTK